MTRRAGGGILVASTMKPHVLLAGMLLLALCPVVRSADEPVDFEKARQYFQKRQQGGTLTPDEEAYVRRAIAARAAARNGAAEKGPGGARKGQPALAPWTGHLTPLTELGAGSYRGEDGGLYGGGRNEPPAQHLASALAEAAKIRPLDASGRESASGRIGFLSVGMSNTTMEFTRFIQLANADREKSPAVVLVDGAQGGQTASRWADPKAPLWQKVDERIKAAGLAAPQIQVAWLKQAEAGPARLGGFPEHARALQGFVEKDLRLLKERFPNLRLVYLSSRIYAGYATTALNPEPYAYEGAFAMRWLIQDQISGKPALNWDPAKGAVVAPLALWGPYLWADGEAPRKADGLFYVKADLSPKDGTHPSESGRQKVAGRLLRFLKADPTARGWFCAPAAGR